MALPTKTFEQFTNDEIATWAGALGLDPNLQSGDPLLAIFQAVATNHAFIQTLALKIVQISNAATAVGGDLDAWMAQFSFLRLPATNASGPVRFGLKSPSSSPLQIPVGSLIQTVGGTVQYQLIADAAQPGFNAAFNAYVIPAGQTTVTATAQAIAAGSASNVQTSQLSQMAFSAGPDSVTNLAPIVNGKDAEPDADYLSRYINLINSRSQGTIPAFLAAIHNVQQGLTTGVIENIKPDGTPLAGFVTVVVDDGSGSPPASLLTAVQLALGSPVRAATIQVTVIGPTLVTAIIALNIKLAPGVIQSVVVNAVQNALILYINSLGIGAVLYYNKLVQVAMDAMPGSILSVQPGSLVVNSGTTDIIATPFQRFITSAINVAVGTY